MSEKNEITLTDRFSTLPARTQDALNALRESPERYYAELPVVRAGDPLTDETPTLAKINRGLGENGALLAIGLAIDELRAWFNVKINLTDEQVVMIAEMILEVHWDLSLNEIKGVFRDKMRKAKLYGKLDGSDILGWLDEYKSESISAVQSIRDSEAREYEASDNAVSYEEWKKNIPPEENYIANIENTGRPRLTAEQQRKKDLDFFKFKMEYLKSKGIIPK